VLISVHGLATYNVLGRHDVLSQIERFKYADTLCHGTKCANSHAS